MFHPGHVTISIAIPCGYRLVIPHVLLSSILMLSAGHTYIGPGDTNRKKNLAELFKPPIDILFTGTFQEVCETIGWDHHTQVF